VKSWLRRHPRVHLHFTPTSSSWLNLVERWFRDLTQQRIRRGSFHAVKELIRTIEEYIENHNQKPQVFVWSAPVERILSKIAKCKEALDAVHPRSPIKDRLVRNGCLPGSHLQSPSDHPPANGNGNLSAPGNSPCMAGVDDLQV